MLDDTEVKQLASKAEVEASLKGWSFDSEKNIACVKVPVKGISKVLLKTN